MATVLCFGDSNTWGISPSGHRYNEAERWATLLSTKLSSKLAAQFANKLVGEYRVIEAGQPNRTLVHNAPFSVDESVGNISGIRYLKPYLLEFQPEVILLMLGTNDLKKRFKLCATEIAQGMYQLALSTLNFKYADKNVVPQVLIVSPPPIYEVAAYVKIYAGAAVKSQQLAMHYGDVAQRLNCAFFDAGSVIQSCSNEGIHWQVEQHAILAEALSDKVAKLLMKTL